VVKSCCLLSVLISIVPVLCVHVTGDGTRRSDGMTHPHSVNIGF